MDKIEKIRAELERLVKMNQTKHGFPAGTACAIRIEAYKKLLAFLDTLSEEPDKSLEEEIQHKVYDLLFDLDGVAFKGATAYATVDDVAYIARHFAQWQKEQMTKEAYVESQIVEDGRIELEGDPLPCLNPIILLPYPQFKPGDKVRIIIVKED